MLRYDRIAADIEVDDVSVMRTVFKSEPAENGIVIMLHDAR